MTSFTTAGPAALVVRFAAGRLAVRTDDADGTITLVDVRPANPDSAADVEHAAATVVEQHGDTIEVIAPTAKSWFGRNPRLDIRAAVPQRSRVDVDVKSADVELAGELGDVSIVSASGDIAVEQANELRVRTASGDVACRSVSGNASVSTASGDSRIEAIDASGELSTASGDVNVGRIAGDVRVRSASGDVGLGVAGGSVTVRTASGDIRVDSLRRGTTEIDSASGDVDLGIAHGTTAWLDVQALSGSVSSGLDPTDAPGGDAETVSIHAHTLSGDIRVRRATH
jgi:DUF4097 and DUF4098 domain-containing protein YvlB